MAKSKHETILAQINKLSQRPRKTATGATKKPSARLKSRRAANKNDGYFPNPNARGKHFNTVIVEHLKLIKHHTEPLKRQAAVSFLQGFIHCALTNDLMTPAEHDAIVEQLRKYAS